MKHRIVVDEETQAYLAAVYVEMKSARSRFPPFRSHHEGYAIIKEELDELWEAIKKHEGDDALFAEAMQVSAMALRFMVDLERMKKQ